MVSTGWVSSTPCYNVNVRVTVFTLENMIFRPGYYRNYHEKYVENIVKIVVNVIDKPTSS